MLSFIVVVWRVIGLKFWICSDTVFWYHALGMVVIISTICEAWIWWHTLQYSTELQSYSMIVVVVSSVVSVYIVTVSSTTFQYNWKVILVWICTKNDQCWEEEGCFRYIVVMSGILLMMCCDFSCRIVFSLVVLLEVMVNVQWESNVVV